MTKTIKVSILIVALIVFVVVVSILAFNAKEQNQVVTDTNTVYFTNNEIGEEVVVRSKVVENNLGCVVDGLCFLLLKLDNKEIKIVYSYGDWPRCEGKTAGVMRIKKGDKVEIFGVVKGTFISVCDSTDYYIRKL